jgi:hypothetical protein
MTSTASTSREVDNTSDYESDTDDTYVQIQGDLAKTTSSLEGIEEGEIAGSRADKEFIIFSKLPIELRLIIWEMALPGPRCITLRLYLFNDPLVNVYGETEEGPLPIFWHLHFSEKCPVTLFTCQESRAVALKHYQLQPSPHYDLTRMLWYIAPLRDTLFMMYANWKGPAVKIIASAIPNLTKLALYADKLQVPEFSAQHLRDFNGLETLILMPCFNWQYYSRDPPSIKTSELGNRNSLDSLGTDVDFDTLQRSFAELENEYTGWKAPKLRIGERRS